MIPIVIASLLIPAISSGISAIPSTGFYSTGPSLMVLSIVLAIVAVCLKFQFRIHSRQEDRYWLVLGAALLVVAGFQALLPGLESWATGLTFVAAAALSLYTARLVQRRAAVQDSSDATRF